MAVDLTKYIARFVEEANDHLNALTKGVDVFQAEGASPELVNELFRSAHTLKGTAGILKLTGVMRVAHALEEVFGALREKNITVNAHVCDMLYQGIDRIRVDIEHLQNTHDPESLPEVDQRLCDAIEAVVKADVSLQEKPVASSDTNTMAHNSEQAAFVQHGDSQAPLTAEVLSASLRLNDTIRMPLKRLDSLIKLTSEVVSSQSQLSLFLLQLKQLHKLAIDKDEIEIAKQLKTAYKQLKDVNYLQETKAKELHENTLKLRMLPLSILFDPATRLIREQSRTLKKQVASRVEGSQIELDRQIVDQLADPMIHIIRNAIDHGIETPEIRRAKGKPAKGMISLLAYQNAGQVVLTIKDDGAGLDIQAIHDKALKKKLKTAEQLQEMSQEDLVQLIFLPGFSTNPIVTDLSGRGVGMDVVRKIIVEDLQGQVQIKTQSGKGCQLDIKIPLSLALMHVMLVKSQNEVVGFSGQYVSEIIRIDVASITAIANRDTITLRNEFITIIKLSDVLELPLISSHNATYPVKQKLLIILKVHQEKIALEVDDIVDEKDMLIKPLPSHLIGKGPVSGMVYVSTYGLISLIDCPRILKTAKQLTEHTSIQPMSLNNYHVLVVDDSLNTREIEGDLLEAWGFKVTLAENGQDGLQKAKSEQFDAIVTDVEMPLMDGFSLTAALRAMPEYASCPIVIVSSREKPQDRQKGIEAGADAYIIKGSFDQSHLIDTLKLLLV